MSSRQTWVKRVFDDQGLRGDNAGDFALNFRGIAASFTSLLFKGSDLEPPAVSL